MKVKAKLTKNKVSGKKQATNLNELLEIVNNDTFQLNIKEESAISNNNEKVKEINLVYAKIEQNNNISKKVESSEEKNSNNIQQKNKGANSQNIINNKEIKKNVNNKFLDIVKTNQPISADEINIKNIVKDGNCFYLSIAFFYWEMKIIIKILKN